MDRLEDPLGEAALGTRESPDGTMLMAAPAMANQETPSLNPDDESRQPRITLASAVVVPSPTRAHRR